MQLIKPLSILGFRLLMPVLLFAQGNFKVSGTIQQAQSKDLQLALYKNYLNPIPEISTATLTNGNYQFTGTLSQPAFAELVYKGGRLKIYLEPGDDLNISFTDDPQHSQTSLTGKGSDNNLFYSTYVSRFSQNLGDSLVRTKIMNQTIDAWENELFALKKSQTEYLTTFPTKDKLSASFTTLLRNDFEYRYWSLLLAYPIIRANSSAQITTVEPLPTVMLDAFTKVVVNNEAALPLDSYRGFIYYYVIYFTSQKNGFKKFNDFSTAADRKVALAKEKLQGKVFDTWLAQFCLDEKDNVSPFMLKSMVNTLSETDKSQIYSSYVKSVCGARMAMKTDKKAEAQNPAAASPSLGAVDTDEDLNMTDMEGKPFKLSDLKGKVVYIDFWASWCGPCRQMIPFSKKMHEELSDKQKKQIVFLYISIDGDENSWKKAVNDMGMEGKLVISPGNWQSKVCSFFKINSIPRYMIMDKKGNIVDYNAKRPADPTVMDDLVNLVK